MLYQNFLTNIRPYYVKLSPMQGTIEHRHPNVELSYCLEGSYDIRIGSTVYHMEAGDLAVIGSTVLHMIPEDASNSCLAMTIEAGQEMLGEYLELFAKATLANPVFHLGDEASPHHALAALFTEIAAHRQNPGDFSELIIKGNLYKIFGYIFTQFPLQYAKKHDLKVLHDIVRIKQALELIHTKYDEPLKVEYVSELLGYGKANFCKTFRLITGDSFHHALNTRRIEVACKLLRTPRISLDEVSRRVGFSDPKVFGRVFKSVHGITPGTYRKRYL